LAAVPDDFVFTRDFLCEPASGRVFALLQPRIGRPVLEAVLECADSSLAQRAADALADAARGGLVRAADSAEQVLAELPAEAGTAFRTAYDQVRAGLDEIGELFDEDDEPGLDFSVLFPPLPDQDDWQLTPRTASILHAVLSLLADHAYDDIELNGGAAVDGADGEWTVFGELPRSTWQEDVDWRRQVARACDDLAGDIESGNLPAPRCHAEVAVTHLALGEVVQWLDEADEDDLGQESLPEHPHDYDWEGCTAAFFRGHAPRDEGPWFEWFGDAEPRDPERGFRR
jgi:hypothetical protein